MKFILFLFFFVYQLASREITFLPAHILGKEPESLKKKEELPRGFAELGAFYTKENFYADLSEVDKVKIYLEEMSFEYDRKPSKVILSRTCEEFSSDFIARSEVSFESSITIMTEVFNCRGKLVNSHETIINDNFYKNFEKHIIKTFHFLSPKTKPEFKSDTINKDEVVFFLDLSGGLSSEILQIKELISNLINKQGLSLGIVLVDDKKIHITPPSQNHSEVKNSLSKIKFSGEVGLDKITQALLKSKTEFSSSKFKKRKFILVTDAKSNKDYDSTYMTALQSLNEIGFSIHLLTGSFFDQKSMNLHKKAARTARAKDIYSITHTQTINTNLGIKTLFLKDKMIYSESSEIPLSEDLNLKELSKLEESKIYSQVEFPHPYNMAEVYSKSMGIRILDKSKVSSNTRTLAEKILSLGNSMQEWSGTKVLVKTGINSIWLNINRFTEDEGKEIVFKTTFIKDDFNSNGIQNLPKNTEIYTEPFPKLLVLEPKQIRNYLEKNPSVTCFITGKVIEVK